MASSFDPYYVWLGIPPKHQPPNHYRLLGIELYEDNADVIDAAANRQTSYLHDMASGPNRKYSQELLNEIAGARRCLLDVERKQKYDDKLRRKSAEENATPPPSDASSSTPEDDTASAESPDTAESKAVTSSTDKSGSDKSTAAKTSEDSSAAGKSSSSKNERKKNSSSTQKKKPATQDAGDKPDAKAEKKKNYAPMIIGVGGIVCLGIIIAVLTSGGKGEPENTVVGIKPGTAQDKDSKDADSGNNNSTGSGTTIDKDLLAHYRFEEPVERGLDETAHLRLGTIQGAPSFVPGPFETAMKLDGKDDSYSVPGSAINTDTGSLAFWMRVDASAIPSTLGVVVAEGKTTKLGISLIDGRIVAHLGVSQKPIETTSVIEPGHWYHIAVAWEIRKKATVFCNGKQIGESFLSGLDIGQAIKFGIHKEKAKIVHSAVTLDDIQFSKRTLDESQIKILMTDAKVTLKAPKIVALVKKTEVVQQPVKDPVKPVTNKKPDPKKPAPPSRKLVKIEEPKGKQEVLLEYWLRTPGNTVAQLRKKITDQSNPDGFRHLKSLHHAGAADGQDKGDHFARRITGFLVPPVSGSYTFRVTFDDQGEFLLSSGTKKDAASLKPIANNGTRQLRAHRPYYFQILHKQNQGTESFNIGWTRPDGVVNSTIDANYLTWKPHHRSFVSLPVDSIVSQPKVEFTKGQDGSQIAVVGDQKLDSIYTVKSRLSTGELSAIRFEMIGHDSLPMSGPGLGPGGRFELQEIKASYSAAGKPNVPIVFQQVLADSSNTSAKFLIDDKLDTSWTIGSSRAGKRTGVMLIPEKSLQLPPGAMLTISIHQRYNIGRFRVLTTGMDQSHLKAVAKQFEISANQKYSKFVNLGGGSAVDPMTKERWVASKPYKKGDWGHVGGKSISVQPKVLNHPVQRCAVEGITAFQAAVPNGSYDVTLFFSENWVDAASKRIFKMRVQDQKQVIIDVFAAAGGPRKMWIYPPTKTARQKVTVKDGQFKVVFAPDKASPILTAISIEER
jgi:hypothetical protein